MRVSDEARVAARRGDEVRCGDFSAALRRAEGRRAEVGRAEGGRSAQRADEQAAARRGAEARGRRAGEGGEGGGEVAPRQGVASALPGVAASQASSGGAGSSVTSAGGGAAPGGAGPAGPAALPEGAQLARAVRALPPVIETFQASGQLALSLDFGGALGVELRRAPGGVEVTLSASAALRPAARAELAGLCRALASRGVTVASAEVRGGLPRRGRP